MAWFPGQEMGDSLADVLFGDVEPQGRLPVTFPSRLEDTPAFEHHPGRNGVATYRERRLVGYRWYDTVGREPLFAFGHGLGYADVAITAARAARSRSPSRSISPTPAPATVWPSCRSTPTASAHDGARDEPDQRLVGFAKLAVPAEGSTTIVIELDPRTYQTWDVGTHEWIEVPGGYELRVGISSRDIAERLLQHR